MPSLDGDHHQGGMLLLEPDPEEPIDEETVKQPSNKPVIGIIYPPPEVRNIVDKTASFVARNGPEFEARIRQNEINNPKFNFLNSGDPYHTYYQHKVREFREGKAVEPAHLQIVRPTLSSQKQDLSRLVEQVIIPKEPPPENEFMADPPSISAVELDIVRLTAMFVARNGRQFLTNLMNREQRNYQFDFLKPQHSMFHYFTKLLEQYTKVLIPPKEMLNRLRKESNNPKMILEEVRGRVEWYRHQEVQRRRAEEEAERERVLYAQIDWHDFVIVETVDYQPHEHGHFPPPTSPDEVGARVLAQERMEELGVEAVEMEVSSDEDDNTDRDVDQALLAASQPIEKAKEKPSKKKATTPAFNIRTTDNTQVRDMDEGSSDEEAEPLRGAPPPPPGEQPASPPPPPPLPKDVHQPVPVPPKHDHVLIRKDYDPKKPDAKRNRVPAPDEYLISPITGERIPASKVQEHMRIGLLDPRWVEDRDRQIQDKLNQEDAYAPGSAIESSLKQLAERRTDIFGVGDEETAIGKKIGEEEVRREEKVTWDGHTASMEAATRAARANITIEEQIHQIHKVKGLLPDEEKERIGPSKPTLSQPPMPPQPKPVPTKVAPPMTVTLKAPPLPPTPVAHPVQPPPPPMPPGMSMMMLSRQGPMVPPMRPLLAMPPRPPMPHMGFPGGPMPMGPAVAMAAVMGAPLGPHMGPPMDIDERDLMMDDDDMMGGPMAKRMKTEEQLIPEEIFMKRHPSPVAFRVQVPNVSDKPEWKCNGQILAITLPLTESVAAIKAKINEELSMPIGKQKLQCEGIFYKDSNSLAYYNIAPGMVIQLTLKERGGRKK